MGTRGRQFTRGLQKMFRLNLGDELSQSSCNVNTCLQRDCDQKCLGSKQGPLVSGDVSCSMLAKHMLYHQYLWISYCPPSKCSLACGTHVTTSVKLNSQGHQTAWCSSHEFSNQLTLCLMCTLAPAANRSFTTEMKPLYTATCRAVKPFCR